MGTRVSLPGALLIGAIVVTVVGLLLWLQASRMGATKDVAPDPSPGAMGVFATAWLQCQEFATPGPDSLVDQDVGTLTVAEAGYRAAWLQCRADQS